MTHAHLTLSMRQLHEIDICLQQIRLEGRANFVLLADITGQLIEVEGNSGTMDPSVLAALAAGESAATHEIARLMDEAPGFKLILHEGRQQNIYLSEIDEELVLAAIFSKRVPIGMVRLITQMTVDKLHDILKQPKDEGDIVWSSQTSAADFEQWLAGDLNGLWEQSGERT